MKTKKQTEMRARGASDLTPKVGEKRVLELENAGLGYVDRALRTPPAPVKVEGGETAAAGPVAQPMVGDSERLNLEDAGDGYVDTRLREKKRSSRRQD